MSGVLMSRFDSLTVEVSAAHDLGSVHKSFTITPSVVYLAARSQKP